MHLVIEFCCFVPCNRRRRVKDDLKRQYRELTMKSSFRDIILKSVFINLYCSDLLYVKT